MKSKDRSLIGLTCPYCKEVKREDDFPCGETRLVECDFCCATYAVQKQVRISIITYKLELAVEEEIF